MKHLTGEQLTQLKVYKLTRIKKIKGHIKICDKQIEKINVTKEKWENLLDRLEREL